MKRVKKKKSDHYFYEFRQELGEKSNRYLLFDIKCLEELGERDAVGFCCFPDGLAAGDSTADTAHAELEQGLGCIGFCLEKIVNGTVCGNFCHTFLSLRGVR